MVTKNYLEGWTLNPGIPEKDFLTAISCLEFALPDDFVQFFRENNGGEGFIGSNYLIIWKAEELVVFNAEYEVDLYAPGIFLFGSNGGGEGYGFDTRAKKMSIVRIPFIGMQLSYATPIAANLTDLFAQLLK
jgi:hypothetical protein